MIPRVLKAFLVWLNILPYGVASALPDMVHPRPHSPSLVVDGDAGYGHVAGGTGNVCLPSLVFKKTKWFLSLTRCHFQPRVTEWHRLRHKIHAKLFSDPTVASDKI